MKMKRLNIQIPKPLKAKLDALRTQGTTASGLIRHLLAQHFSTEKRKGTRAEHVGFLFRYGLFWVHNGKTGG
jgi:metal-responsive CopG/Arc/MetJ family transcriptional regulator